MTLSDLLTDYLRKQGEWKHKGDIEQCSFYHKDKTRYMSDTVARTLRNLESQSIIARKDDQYKKSILYKYIPDINGNRKRYIPFSCRAKGEENKLFKE